MMTMMIQWWYNDADNGDDNDGDDDDDNSDDDDNDDDDNDDNDGDTIMTTAATMTMADAFPFGFNSRCSTPGVLFSIGRK